MTKLHLKNLLHAGDRFGLLTVIGETQKGFIPVRCDCGNEKQVTTGNLRAGNATSCGVRCGLKYASSNLKEGSVFGYFTVLSLPHPRTALVRCICGTEKEIEAYYLLSGSKRSCGCKYKPYKLGQMVHGRRLVQLGTTNSLPKVECLTCGTIAEIAPANKAKCRICKPWDSRLGDNGNVYAMLCPFTGDVRYVGATTDTVAHRAYAHWRGRNKKNRSNAALGQWLRELDAQAAFPGAMRLEEVVNFSLHEREIFWINKMRSEGANLLNIEHNVNSTEREGCN